MMSIYIYIYMIERLPDQNVTNVYENIEFGIRSEIDLSGNQRAREKRRASRKQ